MADQKAGMSEKHYLSVGYKQWPSVKDLTQKKFPCAKNVHKLMLLFWELWFLMSEKWTQAIVY